HTVPIIEGSSGRLMSYLQTAPVHPAVKNPRPSCLRAQGFRTAASVQRAEATHQVEADVEERLLLLRRMVVPVQRGLLIAIRAIQVRCAVPGRGQQELVSVVPHQLRDGISGRTGQR